MIIPGSQNSIQKIENIYRISIKKYKVRFDKNESKYSLLLLVALVLAARVFLAVLWYSSLHKTNVSNRPQAAGSSRLLCAGFVNFHLLIYFFFHLMNTYGI